MRIEDKIFEEEYTVRFSQTGRNKGATNKSLLSFLENTAGAHSAYCKFSIIDIIDKDLTWFILSWKLQVIKRPKAAQKIRVQTWGRKMSKLLFLRDFKILDENGEVLVIATSKWCLVNTKTGRIAKAPENIEEIYHGFRDEPVFEVDDTSKLIVPNSEVQLVDEYKIRRFDLDGNMHVHNLNYVDFAYELLPEDIYAKEELNNVEIMYKKEIKYGQIIKSFLYIEDGVYTIVIKNDTEDIIHAIVKLYN